MRNIISRYKVQLGLAAASVLVGAGLFAANNPAVAQQADEGVAQITVTGARIVKQTIGRSSIGAPIEVVKIGREVSYSDLDLGTHKGASELENRVKSTAKDLCEELDRLYPLEPKDQECATKATDGAMKQVNDAIAAASK